MEFSGPNLAKSSPSSRQRDRPSLTVVPHATHGFHDSLLCAESRPQNNSPSAPAPAMVAAVPSARLSAVPKHHTRCRSSFTAAGHGSRAPASRDTVRPRPTQQAPSGIQPQLRPQVVSQVALPQPSVASPVPATTVAPDHAVLNDQFHDQARPQRRIDPHGNTPRSHRRRGHSSGTIPPVPHTTLRPKPSPVASTES